MADALPLSPLKRQLYGYDPRSGRVAMLLRFAQENRLPELRQRLQNLGEDFDKADFLLPSINNPHSKCALTDSMPNVDYNAWLFPLMKQLPYILETLHERDQHFTFADWTKNYSILSTENGVRAQANRKLFEIACTKGHLAQVLKPEYWAGRLEEYDLLIWENLTRSRNNETFSSLMDQKTPTKIDGALPAEDLLHFRDQIRRMPTPAREDARKEATEEIHDEFLTACSSGEGRTLLRLWQNYKIDVNITHPNFYGKDSTGFNSASRIGHVNVMWFLHDIGADLSRVPSEDSIFTWTQATPRTQTQLLRILQEHYSHEPLTLRNLLLYPDGTKEALLVSPLWGKSPLCRELHPEMKKLLNDLDIAIHNNAIRDSAAQSKNLAQMRDAADKKRAPEERE